MIHLEVRTKLDVAEATNKLKSFFGKEGLGLALSEESSQCLNFEGGGGYVTATLCSEGERTRIDLVSQEWEEQVKKFSRNLP